MGDLERIARTEHERANYQRKDFSGGIGLVAELSEGNTSMRVAYFLMNGTNTLVRAYLVAYPEGRGRELIVPIVDSFAGLNQ